MIVPDQHGDVVRLSLLDELQALESVSELHSRELERLLFLFRASDPGIYQPAALALGRRALMEDAANRSLYTYAHKRRVDLEDVHELNGQRSTRRILLAQVSNWASQPADWRGPPPLTPEQVAEGLPSDPADAAVLLNAVARLLATMDIEGLPEAAEQLLHDLPAPGAGRMVWRRWTELLFAIRAYGIPTQVPGCTGAWRSALDRLVVAAPGEDPVGDGSRRLIALDELYRVAGAHPDALQELSSAWPNSVSEADRRWCRLRFATWCRRHFPNSTPLLTVEPREYSGLSRYAAEIERAWQERAGHIGASPVESCGQALLKTLAEMVESSVSWRRHPSRDRALALFLIVDLDIAVPLSPERVAAFPGVTASGSGLSVPWVLRVTEWEGIAPETLLDARTLHNIKDLRLQEQLVRRDSGGGDKLADVLEHRFRTLIHNARGWDPARFLLRLTARQPAPAFFRRLYSVVQNRTYATPDGQSFPLAQWCQALASENDDTMVPGLDSTDGHRAPVLENLRSLAEQPGVPGEAIRTLVSLLGPSGATVGAPTGTVIGLLRYLGPPAERQQNPEPELDAIQRDLLLLPDLLAPDAWRRRHRAREAVASLDERLDAVAGLLTPLLPRPEATWLTHACEAVRRQSRLWLQGLDAVARMAARYEDTPEHWSDALASIPGELPAALRSPLLLEVWNCLRDQTSTPIALLHWAAEGLDDKADPVIVEAVASYWREQIEMAMARGATMDVKLLMEDPAFATLRARLEDPDLGLRLRRWHFDRLRPLEGIAAARNAGGPEGTGSGLMAFLGHFTAVWIGLLIGAILMLDFGDAWRAMAEAGDMAGIAATFLIGATGTAVYLLANLRRKVRRDNSQAAGTYWMKQLGRVLVFLLACLIYTLAATGGLWLLLSGTAEVVHGSMAMGHIIVWTGFALFAGTFFGLVAKDL
ncbi:hypothetical protein [Aquisalimonas sp.]|uniref:hypothetical protein n=1 Tax=Aquisalimonas sp. TaxID=1872621 RepID=UPI0025C0629E|nr:hypothetical protein [Aquisalimonas sp.]